MREKEDARKEREATSLAEREEQRAAKQVMAEAKKLGADTRKRREGLQRSHANHEEDGSVHHQRAEEAPRARRSSCWQLSLDGAPRVVDAGACQRKRCCAGARRGSECTKPQNLQALISGAKRLEALLMVNIRALLTQQAIDARTANCLAASTAA